MKKTLCVLSCLLLLAGCSTTYHKRNAFGNGYSDYRITKDEFSITFRGNEATLDEDVKKYALLRASEIAVSHGYRFFTIVSSEDVTTSREEKLTSKELSSEFTPANLYETFTNALASTEQKKESTFEETRPGVTLKIRCYHKKPKSDQVVDARDYLTFNHRL